MSLGNVKRRLKNGAIKFVKWVYAKLLPYPRIRKVLSKLNGRLQIIKNPQYVTMSSSILPLKNSNEEPFEKQPGQMNVAMILDEFSYNSFRFECNALPIEPQNWREIFSNNKIDLFFCESAWSGADSKRRPWQGQIYASVNFKRENRSELLDILAHCKKVGIPTVFWNKEDPSHYTDRVHDFVKTAILFDHVFTSAEECVSGYMEEYSHKSVHSLMFASQPRLFNPIEKYKRSDEVIFAGSWYSYHEERSKEMGLILDEIIDSSYPLKIYDRYFGNDDPNHIFPKQYSSYLHPSLPHDQLEVAYKGSKYALNINTVTQSTTMFARRVFELMSSNTLVLSNYSKGIAELFGDAVIFMDGKEKLEINHAKEKREWCLYQVLEHHTYKQRFEKILDVAGISYADATPLVSFIYHVDDLASAQKAVQHYYNMDWGNKYCRLVVDEAVSPGVLQEILCSYNCNEVGVVSAAYTKQYSNEIAVTGYRIYPDLEMNGEFVKKAMLHVCYLEEDVAVVAAENKYIFKQLQSENNMLLLPDCSEKGVVKAYCI